MIHASDKASVAIRDTRWALLFLCLLTAGVVASGVIDGRMDQKHDVSPESMFDSTARAADVADRSIQEAFKRADTWNGSSPSGLQLAFEDSCDLSYRVGEKFICDAHLKNLGVVPRQVTVADDCGQTHGLRLHVISANGEALTGIGRPVIGGPHCFCHQKTILLQPGDSALLKSGLASEGSSGWPLNKPGEFLAIWSYRVQDTNSVDETNYSKVLRVHVSR